jgi:hypothetical protein
VFTNNLVEESTLNTDEAHDYKKPGRQFFGHESVNHSDGEQVRGETTTNVVEGFFGIFKRSMKCARVRFPLFEPREVRR